MEPTQPPSLNFNPETALNYAQKFARPRRVGSGEDKLVAGELAEQLAEFGYHLETQGFQVSTAPGLLITAEILLSLLFILLAMALQYSGSVFFIPASLALLLVLASSGPLNKAVQAGSVLPDENQAPTIWSRICSQLGARYHSENILASLPSASGGKTAPHLYLVAHYDSKSQRISLAARIGLFALAIPGAVLFSVLSLLGIAFPTLNLFTLWLGGLTIAISIPLLTLDYGNESPGAIDNASGVGTVLHLAEMVRLHPGLSKQINLTILLTGAEELSLMGAQAFVQRFKQQLQNQAAAGGVYILNLDGTGVDGQLYYAGENSPATYQSDKPLASLLGEAVEAKGGKLKRFSLPGALFDHIPFADRGFDSITLLMIGRSSWVVHTARDTPDRLEKAGFDQVGRVVSRMIENLARS